MKNFKHLALLLAVVFSILTLSTVFSGCVAPITITLNKSNISLFVSESTKLTAETSRELVGDELLVWSSDNESVATVKNGSIKGVADGTATITVSVGESSASCVVTVKTKRTMTISQDVATINLDEDNKTLVLSAECSDGGEVVWSSSNESVATIVNGVVTGLDVGTVTIYASRDEAKASCTITVIQPSRPYDLQKGNNAAVIADPGVWYYFTKGADAERHAFTTTPKFENGTATLSFDFVDQDMEYYFRYQPNLEVGAQYNVTMTITLSEPGTVRIQNQNYDLNAGENVLTNIPTQTVASDYPINIRPLIYGGSATSPANIVISISNVIITPIS